MRATRTERQQAAAQRATMAREVWAGLARAQKEIPSKYFYDAHGCALFDQITLLPEYYLTRAERSILQMVAPQLVRSATANVLVELGPGNGEKTSILLDALTEQSGQPVYVPVDISASYLEQLAERFSAQYPSLHVRPSRSDISTELKLPPALRGPVLAVFLGSTIGNFDEPDAIALLQRIAAVLRGEDRFTIGFDLKKDPAVLHAAYNDAAGVTAEFNLNILRALNRELDCDFAVDAFKHHAFYNEVLGRIEMHLVAERDQDVRIDSLGFVHIARGESVRTEISCKYDRAQIERLLQQSSFELQRYDVDADRRFALVTAAPVQ